MNFDLGQPLKLLQVNQKAAESLADPEEYPNLFEDWQVALGVESKVAETRFSVSLLLFLSCLLYHHCWHTLSFNVYT